MASDLPRLVTALLRALPRDLREPVAGDLEEAFHARRRRSGALRAHAETVWAAARVAIAFRRERLTHDRGVPPMAEELRRRRNLWDTVRQDFAFSLRLLRRQPGFTAVALFALMLGIGANTAILRVADAVLWRPLPFPQADRVMQLAEQRPRESRLFGAVSPADFYDWRREARSFSAMAAMLDGTANLTGSGEPERLNVLSVTPGFFDALGVAPVYGRDFRADEETVGRNHVAILTDGLWRRRFGADPAIVGRTVDLDGIGYEVIGVLPAAFWWPARYDAVKPLALDDDDRALRGAHFLDVIGRLGPGVTVRQGQEEMAVIGARLSKAYPEENANHAPNVRPLRDMLVGSVRTTLLVLVGAVACVLLIACTNVATMLLARATVRQKELSVRRAIGASRGRLVQQMLIEGLVMALAGGAAGVLLATWGLGLFGTLLREQFSELPGIDRLAVDGRMLLTALAVSLVTGLVLGILPAFAGSERRIGVALHEESRGTSGGLRTRRLRSTLVVVELAVSMVLLAGAGLLTVSFRHLAAVSPGFRVDRLGTVDVVLPGARYGERAQQVAFYDTLTERLRAIPGIERVAVASAPPFTGLDARLNLEIEHRPGLEDTVRAYARLVSPEYFETMGMPLVRGRGLALRDNGSAPAVVVINETAARKYWPGSDPLGQRISLGAPQRWMEIVGIVGDVRFAALSEPAQPEAYIPQRQGFESLGNSFERSLYLVMRSTLDRGALTVAVRTAVKSVDPQQPIGTLHTMQGLIDTSIGTRRLNFVLVAVLAFTALCLTAAGLYGVMGYLVTLRTREIGVRMALGATRRQVLRLVLRDAGAMTGAGIALGVGGALLLTRSMRSLLFDVSAADPTIYAVASLLMAAVALAAVAVPTSRASRVDPASTLRDT